MMTEQEFCRGIESDVHGIDDLRTWLRDISLAVDHLEGLLDNPPEVSIEFKLAESESGSESRELLPFHTATQSLLDALIAKCRGEA
jgi:hypothetical protein